MILKFLQGGLQNQQMEQLFVALDQQPQEVVQELIKNGVNPEDIIKLTEVGVQQKKIKPESAQIIQSTLQQIVKSAKHGAKLNYIKLLNHKCADDEELYYFKKGGRVGCGCKKKMEDGGKTQVKDKSWKAKFKAKQAKAARANNAVDKNCSGVKMKLHKLGGSLNGISFMQVGGEINPHDARYNFAERLKASTEQGNNKFYNLYEKIKRLLNKYPTPISTIPGNEKVIDYINRYPSPIALLPNGREFVMNAQTPLSAAIYLGGKFLNSSKLPERKPIHNGGVSFVSSSNSDIPPTTPIVEEEEIVVEEPKKGDKKSTSTKEQPKFTPRRDEYIQPTFEEFVPSIINAPSIPSTTPEKMTFNHYNKSQTRQWLRDNGVNPYNLGGLQRKKIRKALNSGMTDVNKILMLAQ